MWRLVVASIVWLAATERPLLAQTEVHPLRQTVACATARATRALSNQTDPRRFDPDWVKYVINDGQCVTLLPSNYVDILDVEGDMTKVSVVSTTDTRGLYVKSGDLESSSAVLTAPVPFMPEVRPSSLEKSTFSEDNHLHTSSYEQGRSNRSEWENWFSRTSGSERSGAEFWASRRSLQHPPACNGSGHSGDSAYLAGCLEARRQLARSDILRKSDPLYRQGWNADIAPLSEQSNETQPETKITLEPDSSSTAVTLDTKSGVKTPVVEDKAQIVVRQSQYDSNAIVPSATTWSNNVLVTFSLIAAAIVIFTRKLYGNKPPNTEKMGKIPEL